MIQGSPPRMKIAGLFSVEYPPVIGAVDPLYNNSIGQCTPGSRGSGWMRGFFTHYVGTAISAMIHPLGKLAERVPHGDCDSADQSRGPLAFGAGGSPQAQRGGAHR